MLQNLLPSLREAKHLRMEKSLILLCQQAPLTSDVLRTSQFSPTYKRRWSEGAFTNPDEITQSGEKQMAIDWLRHSSYFHLKKKKFMEFLGLNTSRNFMS